MNQELNIFVGLLTEEEKDLIVNKPFTDYCYFNPIQDANGNWIISQEEINGCTNLTYEWIKTLPLIKFEQKLPETSEETGLNNLQ